MPLREALIEAGAIRLRPILMTTFALIAGMIPVALGRGEGAQFRAPLGVAVIGGVLTSTLLTLLVIPTVYEVFDEGRARLMRLFGARPKQMTAEHQIPPGRVLEIDCDRGAPAVHDVPRPVAGARPLPRSPSARSSPWPPAEVVSRRRADPTQPPPATAPPSSRS